MGVLFFVSGQAHLLAGKLERNLRPSFAAAR